MITSDGTGPHHDDTAAVTYAETRSWTYAAAIMSDVTSTRKWARG